MSLDRAHVGPLRELLHCERGASAAILGLLVVAVSVVNADDSDAKTRERRTVLAGSAFLALVDAFFASIVALTGRRCLRDSQPCHGGGRLAGHGPLDTAGKAGRELLPWLSHSQAEPHFCRHLGRGLFDPARSRHRARDRHAQLCTAARALVLVIVGLFGSALGRAWEVTGIRQRLSPDTDRT